MRGGGTRLDPGVSAKCASRAIEMTGLRVQQRHIVMERALSGRLSSLLLRPDDLFAHDLPWTARAEPRPVGGVARHDLEPELRHLLGRPLAVGHAPRRTLRVVRVLRGVVVGVIHRDRRPRRQELGPGVSKDALPLEIPVAGLKSATFAIRRATSHKLLTSLREVVSVRLHGVDVDVSVQEKRIGHHIRAGRPAGCPCAVSSIRTSIGSI